LKGAVQLSINSVVLCENKMSQQHMLGMAQFPEFWGRKKNKNSKLHETHLLLGADSTPFHLDLFGQMPGEKKSPNSQMLVVFSWWFYHATDP